MRKNKLARKISGLRQVQLNSIIQTKAQEKTRDLMETKKVLNKKESNKTGESKKRVDYRGTHGDVLDWSERGLTFRTDR